MNLKTKLYKHQVAAINKIKDIKAAALFMDMGTGKTRTVIEYIYIKYALLSQIIWITPVRTKYNLKDDINKHCNLDVCFLENKEIKKVVIVGTETISQSDKMYLKLNNIIKENCIIIVDESHMFKNHNTKRVERLNKLREKSLYRLILTGTPSPLGIQDLYTQFYFLHPKILGYNSFFSFAANHLEYHKEHRGMIVASHNTEYITKKINPYTYQVKKDECLDLPPKTYSFRYVDVTKEQSDVYDEVKEDMLNIFSYEEYNSTLIFMLFLYLHRIANGYFVNKIKRLNVKYNFINYNKAKVLKETLDEIDLSKNKVVIFYKYNSDLEMINKYVDVELKINGNVSLKKQSENIKKLSENKSLIFVNIKSGSTGLNLQMCNYAIFYNNTFDYALRIQAEDRLHRIGQTKNVHIIDLICTKFENIILDKLRNKENLMKEIMEEIKKVKDDKKLIKKFKEKFLDD